MRPFRSSALGALLLCWACAGSDSLADDLVQNGLLAPTGPRREVIAKLGRPDSIASRAVPNRFDPMQADSVVELYYPGLRMIYRVVGPDGESEFLNYADVWENGYLKYPELGVGATAASLVEALGEPGARTDSTYAYSCRSCMGAGSPVIFHLSGQRVSRVEYTFYVD